MIFDLFRVNNTVSNPPIGTFFSIISIFSYFTLFAPILSPVSRVVYSGGGRSRREVVLSSPVKSKDLLYGNLLSNLAFFLPFFAFIGTLSLSPFMGTGRFNPLITAILLFIILSLLILLGLVSGTLVSPIIFNFIGKQNNEVVRAFVTISISMMMILSLPLLRYLLENVDDTGQSIGPMIFLPFILAGSLIIYVLYGNVIGINPLSGFLVLTFYVVIIFLIGWRSANYVYNLTDKDLPMAEVKPTSMINRSVDNLTKILPKSIRTSTSAILKGSIRDVEHLSRLTIGLAVTVFMIFALSSQGLFRNAQNFGGNIERAVVIFSLILSSASVIFIEASSFTVQHRDMFTLIKSAPNGPRKFILSKAAQMAIVLLPVYGIVMLIIAGLGFIPFSSLPFVLLSVSVILFTLISISLAIYLVSPSDNEEDITNFMNLLIFYVIAFILGIIPVSVTIAEYDIKLYHVAIFLGLLAAISFVSLKLAIRALQEMDLETLDSMLTRKIHHSAKMIFIFLLSWNILPLFAIPVLLITTKLIVFFVLSAILTLLIPIYILGKINREIVLDGETVHTNLMNKLKYTSLILILMIVIAQLMLFMLPISGQESTSAFQIIYSFGISRFELLLILVISVLLEEFIFRGFLVSYGSRLLNPKEIAILTTTIFALMHVILFISFLNAFMQGFLLVWLRFRTGSVKYPMLAHLFYNLLIFSVVIL